MDEQEPILKVYTSSIANKHTVYINDVVEPEYYNDLFHHLKNCTESDVFEIVINSYGGNENTAIQLYNEIKSCNAAAVIGSVSGYCCSAGTIILLACNAWSITKTSKIMIHSPSGYIGGKSHESRAASNFEDKWVKDFFTMVYKGFLSDKEINDVLGGKDIWLTGEETVSRLRKFQKKA